MSSTNKIIKKRFIKKQMKASMIRPGWWYIFHPFVYAKIRNDAEEDWNVAVALGGIALKDLIRKRKNGKTT